MAPRRPTSDEDQAVSAAQGAEPAAAAPEAAPETPAAAAAPAAPAPVRKLAILTSDIPASPEPKARGSIFDASYAPLRIERRRAWSRFDRTKT